MDTSIASAHDGGYFLSVSSSKQCGLHTSLFMHYNSGDTYESVEHQRVFKTVQDAVYHRFRRPGNHFRDTVFEVIPEGLTPSGTSNKFKVVSFIPCQNVVEMCNGTFTSNGGSTVYSMKDGRLHSFNDEPATTEAYPDERILKHYKNGVLHRTGDKPAVVHILADGDDVSYEAWYENGLKHRTDDKPAVINHVWKIYQWFYKDHPAKRPNQAPYLIDLCNLSSDMSMNDALQFMKPLVRRSERLKEQNQ